MAIALLWRVRDTALSLIGDQRRPVRPHRPLAVAGAAGPGPPSRRVDSDGHREPIIADIARPDRAPTAVPRHGAGPLRDAVAAAGRRTPESES